MSIKNEHVIVNVEVLEHGKGLDLPFYATAGSSGMDLQAALPEDAPVTLQPLERKLIPLGFKTSFPAGYEIQIRPRSGNALKKGLTVLNSPGTIDSDYRGEHGVLLVNLSNTPVTISRKDKIAQAVLCKVETAKIEQVFSLDETVRGSGGFGSTGN